MKRFLVLILAVGVFLGLVPANAPVQAAEEKNGASLFEVPYVSTYYFDPKPMVNTTIEIPLYITDYEQSEYLKNDTSKRLDLIYEVDGSTKTLKSLPLGDQVLTLGKLSEGKHTFSVQVYDPETGLWSHKLFNELWVIDPAKYAISEAQTYYMTQEDLARYGIYKDNNTDAQALLSTRDGLSKLFADKQAAGYRKCVLLKGIYRINGEKTTGANDPTPYCITIPTNFTVDMNGSTFKLDTIETENTGCIVRMTDAVDSHLVNGTLEGDRFERMALELETEQANKLCKGEKINTLIISGGKYCSAENLIVKNTTGHAVGSGGVIGPYTAISYYSKTALLEGREIADEACSTSDYLDLKKIIDWDPDEDYVYFAHIFGYKGIKGDSPILYVNFYDENKKYMEMVTGFQFRKIRIPSGARYARVTLLGDIDTSGNIDNVFMYAEHLGDYCAYTDIDFYDTRTTALVACCGNNILIEDCTYTRCGNSITPAAVDFEDGWEQCQDYYYRNNSVLEAAGTATFIDCAGFNHVLENNPGHKYELRSRVYGGVIKNANGEDTKIKWFLGTRKTGAFGRVYQNDCGYISFSDSTGANETCVDFKVKDSTITNSENSVEWTVGVPGKVVYENCVFSKFAGKNASFTNCVIAPAGRMNENLYFTDCTFQTSDGSSEVGLDLSYDGDRVFDHCEFKGKTTLWSSTRDVGNCLGVFRDCTFEDLKVSPNLSLGDTTKETIFEDCTIHSAADAFIYAGPAVYSKGELKLTFTGCDITHSGNELLYLYAKPGGDSQITFDGCTIHKTSGVLISGWDLAHSEENAKLTVLFKDSEIAKSLTEDLDFDPAHIKISLETGVEPTVKITSAPTAVEAGQVVKIAADATGAGTLSYQWQSRKNASAGWTNSGQSGAKTKTLSVKTLAGLSGWQFRCVVTDENKKTAVSDAVVLTVRSKFTKQPANVYVSAGSTATFTVEMTEKGGLSYQWLARKNASSAWVNSSQNGAKTKTLSVSTVAGLNGWQFCCAVTDGNGDRWISKAAKLTIVPKITAQPKSRSATAGSVATFTVEATGKGTLTYRWQARKNAASAWVNSSQSGAKTKTLSVATLAGLNGWQFRCVVTDGNGISWGSNAATLTVVPKITAQPKDRTVTAGSTATFTVEATGKGPLTYQWQSRKNDASAWSNSAQSGAKTKVLSAKALAGLSGWQFRCVVTDGNGEKAYSKGAILSVRVS